MMVAWLVEQQVVWMAEMTVVLMVAHLAETKAE
jgi:hypothetical protein